MSTLPTSRKPGLPVPAQPPAPLRSILNKLAIRTWSRSTPARLRAAQVLGITGAALLGLAAWHTHDDLRNAVQTVGKDTVPSIVAALHIRADLAEANADAVNAFLLKENTEGPNWSACRHQMDQVHREMMTAAGNITYGKEESDPIYTIMTSLAAYEQEVGMGRGALAGGTSDPVPQMLAADHLMHATILPACTALAHANSSHLDSIYNAYHTRSLATLFPVALMGALLLAGLGYVQWDLFVSMRRIVNPGLAAATLTLILFSFYGMTTFFSARSDLKIAKQDAFDSLNALWEARSVGQDANAEESLYLLLHGRSKEQFERTTAFHTKADRLMPMDPNKALTAVRSGEKVGGFLGAELANITFDGEKEAAMNTLTNWASYYTIDAKIRDLEKSGKFDEALALNLGTKPGQSNWAFAQFDNWLGNTLEINDREFNAAIARAFGTLDSFPYVLALSVLLIAGACFAGIKPRLDEYRF